MRALVRLTNAIFTRDRLVARDLNRYTEEDVRNYLNKLGFSVGESPVLHWGCPQGKYQVLADILGWVLTASNEFRLKVYTPHPTPEQIANDDMPEPRRMRIVVSEEQAQLCVPYKPGSPYVACDSVLRELGLPISDDGGWNLPFDWVRLATEGALLFGGVAHADGVDRAPPVPGGSAADEAATLLDIDTDLLLDPLLVGVCPNAA